VVNTPLIYSDTQLTDLDWQFKSTQQPNQHNRVSFWPRGKVLGGCSSTNVMLYVRGDKDNYDSWERDGCTGWSFKEVLPYFIKSENAQGPGLDPGFHGKGGPLTINIQEPNSYTSLCMKASAQAGLPINKDYNGASMIGMSRSQVNIEGGVRQNTSRVFLGPHRATRKNLTVATGAHVTRILFQGDTAVGVQLKRGSVKISELRTKPTEVVFCKREVIVSGGAVNSPWLLMNSGVGPRQELEALGIPVVADLPVGRNLQDHLFAAMGYESSTTETFPPAVSFAAVLNLAKYLWNKTGILGFGLIQATGFFTTGLRNDGSPAPDLQLHFLPACPSKKTAEAFNLSTKFWTEPEQYWGTYGMIYLPTLLRPKSVGEIRLRSKDPLEYPIIEPNYFTDPEGVRGTLALFFHFLATLLTPRFSVV